MTDEYIRELQATWRAQPAPTAAVVAKLKRGRWTPHAVIWLEILQGVVAIVFGVAFAWLAIRTDHLLVVLGFLHSRSAPEEAMALVVSAVRPSMALGAVALLTAAPALAWLAVRARQGSLKWEDETPESVLQVGLRRADASLRANRIGRWNVLVLAALVVVFLAMWALSGVPTSIIAINTIIYAGLLAAAWLWLDVRRAHVRGELETCLKLLEDFDGDGQV